MSYLLYSSKSHKRVARSEFSCRQRIGSNSIPDCFPVARVPALASFQRVAMLCYQGYYEQECPLVWLCHSVAARVFQLECNHGASHHRTDSSGGIEPTYLFR